ncbi:MAG: hypothetical protein WCP11_02305 [Candidatus Saccharibacteria bacterium]
MFLVGILSWWYGKGWRARVHMAMNRLRTTADIFSVGLLLRTLFNPFRQISADASGKSISEKLRAAFDKLLSRIIGATVRSFMIIFGLVVIILQFLFGMIMLIFWLFMPLLPAAGVVLMILGWVPQWAI